MFYPILLKLGEVVVHMAQKGLIAGKGIKKASKKVFQIQILDKFS